MAFIDEVEGFEKKARLRRAAPLAVVGIVALVLAIVFFVLQGVLGSGSSDFSVEQGTASSVATAGKSTTELSEGASSETETSSSGAEGSTTSICVYMTGAVKKPGVYTFETGARVADAVEKAGGFTVKADKSSLNLARKLEDGEQIDVMTRAETKRRTVQGIGGSVSATGSTAGSSGTTTGGDSQGKVNINTAGLEELKTLNGIGDVTAQKIIDYRESSGPFATPEDIKNVSGIGDKRYEAIADCICV
ncbi:MAG: helix-hairpin-helix domain-containing protein [Eggerthellaceae bacterium]|jgi:competence protein ComEA